MSMALIPRSLVAIAFVAVSALPLQAHPAARQAQAQSAQPPEPSPDNAITAGQIQRWFEAFTVLQAQDALHLSESQYGRFVTRLKALQETRRRHQQARQQIL